MGTLISIPTGSYLTSNPPSTGYFGSAITDPLDDNLLHYWKMEDASGLARVDSHGYLAMGDVGAINRVAGKKDFGAALEFTGEYLTGGVGNDITRNKSAMSFSFWFYPTFLPASAQFVFIEDFNADEGNGRLYIATYQSGELWLRWWSNTTSASTTERFTGNSSSPHVFVINNWYHVLATFDVATEKMYGFVNGVKWIDVDMPGVSALQDLQSFSGPFIGHRPTDSSTLNATIDEFAIWDAAPEDPAAFALALYNAGSGRFYSV